MTDLALPRSNYAYSARRTRSPGAMAAAIAINGGVVALLILSPARQFVLPAPQPPIHVIDIKDPPVPPEQKVEHKKDPVVTQKPLETVQEDVKPFIVTPILPPLGGTTMDGTTEFVKPPIVERIPPVVPHEPVFRIAQRDPRYADAFHPDYPYVLRREGLEGSVTVRVTIDERGRVIDVALVKATDKAFFEETRKQALKHWRFLPATSDGAPVRSVQTLTVHFQLDA